MRARLRAAHGRPGLVVGSRSRSRGVRRRCLYRKCHRAAPGSAFTHSFPLSLLLFYFLFISLFILTGNRIGLGLLADHPAIPPARSRSGRTRAAPRVSAQLGSAAPGERWKPPMPALVQEMAGLPQPCRARAGPATQRRATAHPQPARPRSALSSARMPACPAGRTALLGAPPAAGRVR